MFRALRELFLRDQAEAGLARLLRHVQPVQVPRGTNVAGVWTFTCPVSSCRYRYTRGARTDTIGKGYLHLTEHITGRI